MTNSFDKLSPRERGILGFAANATESFFDLAIFAYKVHGQLKRYKVIQSKFSYNPNILFAGWKYAIPSYGIVGYLQTWTDRTIEQLITHSNDTSAIKRAVSSLLGGAIASPFLCSIESTLTNLQIKIREIGNHKNITFIKEFKAVYLEYGLCKGNFRGTLSTLGRDSPFAYGYIEFPRAIKPRIKQYFQNDTAAEGISSALSAVVMTVVTQPFDAIKTAMQGDMRRKKFDTFSQTIKIIYNEHGLPGFMYGLHARFFRSAFAIFYLHFFLDKGTKFWERFK